MRILAGQYKGRSLLGPVGRGTRPITASVKKSLFDMLADRLGEALVLDLYCGTGTIGLEAMSRGARHCWFAERDRRALTRLSKNIQTLGLADRCTIWRGDVPARLAGWLGQLAEPVDLAFVDPPYSHVRTWDWQLVAKAVFAPLAGALAADGLVILRLPGKAAPPDALGPLAVNRLRRYGDMQVLLLGRQA